ncbi:hypothetical protein [Microvirga aerophila]|uniref:Uncharacterized protein n=1 Tax=Microvirga aerophila TaxID=670291 RepID=A0A512BW53_9HYPH|nr:hypothetical protein [Microvirga aerophila]GEO16155.1 hypothetical protein MAE02_38510 [Microvirga aerophila]
MTYRLTQLAPGAYDLLLKGKVIGSVVRGGSRDSPIWIAELLRRHLPHQRPMPFTEQEHEFKTLEQVCNWLQIPKSLEAG